MINSIFCSLSLVVLYVLHILYIRYLLWLSKSAFHSCFETVSSASLSKHVQYRPKLLTFLPIHIFIEYGTLDVVRFISISKKNKQLQSYELNGSLMIFYDLNPMTSNEQIYVIILNCKMIKSNER